MPQMGSSDTTKFTVFPSDPASFSNSVILFGQFRNKNVNSTA